MILQASTRRHHARDTHAFDMMCIWCPTVWSDRVAIADFPRC